MFDCCHKIINKLYSILAFVERFNGTLQKLIYSFISEVQSYAFHEYLPKILDTYNNRKHRMINMSPTQAEDLSNRLLVRLAHEDKYSKYSILARKKPKKFKIGQQVRVALDKHKFSRGYKQQFAEEIFKIKSIKENLPIILYELQSLTGEPLSGGFYSNELQAISEDIPHLIDKIIKKRGNKVLVSWKGYPDSSYNTWVQASNIKKF